MTFFSKTTLIIHKKLRTSHILTNPKFLLQPHQCGCPFNNSIAFTINPPLQLHHQLHQQLQLFDGESSCCRPLPCIFQLCCCVALHSHCRAVHGASLLLCSATFSPDIFIIEGVAGVTTLSINCILVHCVVDHNVQRHHLHQQEKTVETKYQTGKLDTFN